MGRRRVIGASAEMTRSPREASPGRTASARSISVTARSAKALPALGDGFVLLRGSSGQAGDVAAAARRPGERRARGASGSRRRDRRRAARRARSQRRRAARGARRRPCDRRREGARGRAPPARAPARRGDPDDAQRRRDDRRASPRRRRRPEAPRRATRDRRQRPRAQRLAAAATQLAASAANALGHAAEGPATTRSSPVPAFAGREAAFLIAEAYADPDDPDRATLALGALLSGYSIDANGYGLHHVLSQTLARLTPAWHGQANAAMLPHTLLALARRGATGAGEMIGLAAGLAQRARRGASARPWRDGGAARRVRRRGRRARRARQHAAARRPRRAARAVRRRVLIGAAGQSPALRGRSRPPAADRRDRLRAVALLVRRGAPRRDRRAGRPRAKRRRPRRRQRQRLRRRRARARRRRLGLRSHSRRDRDGDRARDRPRAGDRREPAERARGAARGRRARPRPLGVRLQARSARDLAWRTSSSCCAPPSRCCAAIRASCAATPRARAAACAPRSCRARAPRARRSASSAARRSRSSPSTATSCRCGRTRARTAVRAHAPAGNTCCRFELAAHAPRVAAEAIELLSAPPCPAGRATIVLDGDQLALQIHESIGHALELDRMLLGEAAYAGTSWVTARDLGGLRYGSDALNITADATLPGGLGSFGWDDEGVAAARTPLIEEGILRGGAVRSPVRRGDRPRALRRLRARRRLRAPADRAHDERLDRARRGRHACRPDRRHGRRPVPRDEPLVVDRRPPPAVSVRDRGRARDPRRRARPAAAQPVLRRHHAPLLGRHGRRLLGGRVAAAGPRQLRQGRAGAVDARLARRGARALSRRRRSGSRERARARSTIAERALAVAGAGDAR